MKSKHLMIPIYLLIIIITLQQALSITYIGERLFNDDGTSMNNASCNMIVYSPDGTSYYNGATLNFDNFYYKTFNITINGNYLYYINCSNSYEYKVKSVLNQNTYDQNTCIQNNFCYVGDLLFDDNNNAVSGANCNYNVYQNSGVSLINGSTLSNSNYFYSYLNISNFGDYVYYLNCTDNVTTTTNFYDLSVVDYASTVVINNNNQYTTITSGGGGGGVITYQNNYYNNVTVSSLTAEKGTYPGSFLWGWGIDLTFENIAYFLTQTTENKYQKSISRINERESEFFYCISLNDVQCSQDVVDELINNVDELKVDIQSMKLKGLETKNHQATVNNYLSKLQLLLDESKTGFEEQIIKNMETLKTI